jgi:translation initiation factor 2B subunit (eIF-2B alpha/beta/delta family)
MTCDDYLNSQHTTIKHDRPAMISLDKAYELLKQGYSRAEVVRASGLTAKQVDELHKRARRS